ncbi:MAG: YceD family protein [Burkholderiales bacterium]
MSGRPVVDSVEFARLASTLKGEVPVAELRRLHDVLAQRSGTLSYVLSGSMGADGRPHLFLKLSGRLNLTCQRCLGSLEQRLESKREFVLLGPGDPDTDVADEPETVEHVPAEPKLDVVWLVEEEALLQLPMSATHTEGSCSLARSSDGGPGTASPFAALAALKTRPRS